MTYRTEVIEFHEPWDLVQWGPHHWKIEVGERRSSPITGPRETLDRLRRGEVTTPVTLDVESGKTYVLRGEHKRGPHSAVGFIETKTTRGERLVSWVADRLA